MPRAMLVLSFGTDFLAADVVAAELWAALRGETFVGTSPGPSMRADATEGRALLVDCTRLRDRPTKPASFEDERVLATICAHDAFPDVMADAVEVLLRHSVVALHCRKGRHRSAAVALVLAQALRGAVQHLGMHSRTSMRVPGLLKALSTAQRRPLSCLLSLLASSLLGFGSRAVPQPPPKPPGAALGRGSTRAPVQQPRCDTAGGGHARHQGCDASRGGLPPLSAANRRCGEPRADAR